MVHATGAHFTIKYTYHCIATLMILLIGITISSYVGINDIKPVEAYKSFINPPIKTPSIPLPMDKKTFAPSNEY